MTSVSRFSVSSAANRRFVQRRPRPADIALTSACPSYLLGSRIQYSYPQPRAAAEHSGKCTRWYQALVRFMQMTHFRATNLEPAVLENTRTVHEPEALK